MPFFRPKIKQTRKSTHFENSKSVVFTALLTLKMAFFNPHFSTFLNYKSHSLRKVVTVVTAFYSSYYSSYYTKTHTGIDFNHSVVTVVTTIIFKYILLYIEIGIIEK